MSRTHNRRHDDDVLRDGERRRVPMTAMDSVQRAIAATRRKLAEDALVTDSLSLHRPGYRMLTGDAAVTAQQEVARARAEYLDDLTSINGECFRAYVEQQLVPLLKPGDIVIMDNLGSHKSAALRALIRAAGARLWYLPPYSPDLNPIEQAFAKIKHWMRSAQKRTIEHAWRHIGSLVETIDPTECNNYFANAGYASVKK